MEVLIRSLDEVFLEKGRGPDKQPRRSRGTGYAARRSQLQNISPEAQKLMVEHDKGQSYGDALREIVNRGGTPPESLRRKGRETAGKSITDIQSIDEAYEDLDKGRGPDIQPRKRRSLAGLQEMHRQINNRIDEHVRAGARIAPNDPLEKKRAWLLREIKSHPNYRKSEVDEDLQKSGVKGRSGRKPTGRTLSIPDQHQLRIVTDNLRNPLKGKFLGGPTGDEAKEIYHRLTGREWTEKSMEAYEDLDKGRGPDRGPRKRRGEYGNYESWESAAKKRGMEIERHGEGQWAEHYAKKEGKYHGYKAPNDYGYIRHEGVEKKEDLLRSIEVDWAIDIIAKAKIRDPGALAAAIGRKKYGASKMSEMSAKARKREKKPKGEARQRLGGGGRFAKLEGKLAAKKSVEADVDGLEKSKGPWKRGKKSPYARQFELKEKRVNRAIENELKNARVNRFPIFRMKRQAMDDWAKEHPMKEGKPGPKPKEDFSHRDPFVGSKK